VFVVSYRTFGQPIDPHLQGSNITRRKKLLSISSVFKGLIKYGWQCFVTASYVKVCQKSDPDFDACLINSVETLRPRLNKGKCTVIANFPSQADGFLPLYPILSQTTPEHTLPACLFVIPSNTILPRSRPRHSKRSVCLSVCQLQACRLLHVLLCTTNFCHTCHMSLKSEYS
jgi:hypothetical protein